MKMIVLQTQQVSGAANGTCYTLLIVITQFSDTTLATGNFYTDDVAVLA
jgi:hypothetical protein